MRPERWLYTVPLRLRSLFLRRRVERELSDEMAYHLEMETAENIQRGMARDDARCAAMLKFGRAEQIKERCRDRWGVAWWDGFRQDLRYGARMLVRNPGFYTVASILLAMGIGINTAIFSIVNAVLFRPLPFRAPQELVYLFPAKHNFILLYDAYLAQHENPGFSALLAHIPVSAKVTVSGEAHEAMGEAVTANYFEVLGARMEMGRDFSKTQDHEFADQTEIVVSQTFWRTVLGGNPAIIGKEIKINGKTFTIIGVTGEKFEGISLPWSPSKFWIPYPSWAELAGYLPDLKPAFPVARLKPGITINEAQAIATTIDFRIHPKSETHLVLLPANRMQLPFDRSGTLVPARLAAGLLTVTGIVLLTAIANLAGILMARGITRRSEIAARLAFGATRRRIVRQLLTEGVLLATIGGVFGVVLSRLMIALYIAATPPRFGSREFLINVPADTRVLIFTCLTCVGVGIAMGLGPALQASRTNFIKTIACGSAAASDRTRSALRHWILVPQICLSLVLLLVASGFVRNLLKTELADPGYESEDRMVVDLTMPSLTISAREARTARIDVATKKNDFEKARAAYREIITRTESLPDVESCGLTSQLPFSSGVQMTSMVSQDAYFAGNVRAQGIVQTYVSKNVLHAMGIKLLNGRCIDERDSTSRPPVVMVSEAIGHTLWPGQNPVGKYAAIYDSQSAQAPTRWFEVVGVVRDVRPALSDAVDPVVYFSLEQQPVPWASLVVRVRGHPGNLEKTLKSIVFGLGGNFEIRAMRVMKDAVGELLYPRRMITAILCFAGLFALFLATIGIYGVVSYSVARRAREIGIRTALGAQKTNIMRMVIGEGARVAVLGSTLGIILALAALRIVSSFISPLPSLDLISFMAVMFVAGLLVLAACYVPARRAAAADPIKALREL